MSTDSAQKGARIYLVHGTFAANAAWTLPPCPKNKNNSSIHPKLIEELKKRNVTNCVLEAMPWASSFLEAWFTQRARSHGLKRLKAHVSEIRERAANEDIYFIAHSHGGNIVLDLLQQEALDGVVRGVICMNTPFLIMFKRNLDASLRTLVWLFFMSVIIIITMQIITYQNFTTMAIDLLKGEVQVDDRHIYFTISMFVAVVLFCVSILVKWQERQEDIVKTFNGNPIRKTRVLSAWNAGDEVYSSLALIQALGNMIYFMFNRLVVLAILLLSWFWADEIASGAQLKFWQRVVNMAGSVSLLYLVLFFATIFLSACTVVPVLGFSAKGFFNALITKLSVGYLPVKAERSSFVEFNLGRSSLNHSKIYTSEMPISMFAEWIAQDIAERRNQ